MTISLISIAATMAFTMIAVGVVGITAEFRRQQISRAEGRQKELGLERIYTNHR